MFDLQSYALCLKNPVSILTAYANTFGVTFVGTACAVFLTSMTGYVLSRQDFPYRNKFSFFFFFTTLFHGGLVPWYILCVRYLKLKNSYLALILPLMFSVWNMIIAKSFMRGIPSAITESAKIDGANDFLHLYPADSAAFSKPLLATLTLFAALTYWNDWFNNMLFVTKEEMFMLQYYLQRMLANAEALKRVASNSGISIPSLPLEGMKMAMTIIATGPIVLMYPLVQRVLRQGPDHRRREGVKHNIHRLETDA